MPIPRRIVEKRGINRVDLLERARGYLVENCDNDSLHDSLIILDSLDFMCRFSFQHLLHSLPLSCKQRKETEINYMKAIMLWKM